MIRVVVVDDSLICRTQLTSMLEADGDLQVVGAAGDGHRALALIAQKRPDLVTVDWKMPGMDGLDLISALMATQPVPVLVVTGQPTASGDRGLVFEALRRGALDLAEKPGDEAAAHALRDSVRTLARVPVVRHVRGAGASRVPPATQAQGYRSVAIGASSGGPTAVAALLAQLPADFALPIAIVQHLPHGFGQAYAAFLRTKTRLPVVVLDRAVRRSPGHIYLAADGAHLVASDRLHFAIDAAPPRHGHRPSVSVLFESLAQTDHAACAAIVLSGIGDDGVSGLAAVRDAGGLTIAQDEASCAVFGMPRAAREAGVATHQLAPEAIAQLLVGLQGKAGV
jgi:two-component system chemotaxis response regulator CheB